jgi:lysophospholipase L1-like esterase
LFAVQLCVIFLVLEAGVRMMKHPPPFDEDIYRVPKPFVMYGGKPRAEILIPAEMKAPSPKDRRARLDDQGFRVETPLPKKKPAGEFRVIVLGGSAVFYGSPLANTIPGQLERLFHEDGARRLRVYNFGVLGYKSGEELALLLHTVTDYSPDLVIAYDGANDIHEPYFYDPRPGYPYNFPSLEEGLRRMRYPLSWTSIASALRKSQLFRTFFEKRLVEQILNMGELRRESGYGTGPWEEAVISAYLGNIDRMCSVAAGFGFKLEVFLQPIVHLKTPLLGVEKPWEAFGGDPFRQYILRQYARARSGFVDLQAAHSADDRCRFHDVSLAFTDHAQERYWDYVHVNNDGNRHIATAIYADLKNDLASTLRFTR